MRAFALCLVSWFAFGCASTGHEVTEPVAGTPWTLDRLLSGPSLTGSPPSAPRWSRDSRHLAFLWGGPNASRREIFVVGADGEGLRRLTGGEPVADDDSGAGVSEFAWMPGGRSLVLLRGAALWRVDLDGRAERLIAFEGRAHDLAVSPTGDRAAVLRDGDLWLFEFATTTLRRGTTVYVPPVSRLPLGRYRRPEVEIGTYVWGGPSYEWSPDGRSIAVHHVDRRGLPLVPFPSYLGAETDPNPVRRGYPGDPNEARRVGILDAESLDLEFLDLPDPTATRIVGFAWSSDGRLLIDRDSDTAVDRWLHVFDPATGNLREIWHDRRATRIYTNAGSAWHPDGEQVIVLADAADRYGLYALHLDRPEPRLLTDPGFDVMGPPIVTGSGVVFFESNEPSPYERHVFWTTVEEGEPTRVTRRAGENRAVPSPDGRTLAFLHSDDSHPTELYLTPVEGPAEPRRITDSVPQGFSEQSLAVARYVSFPSLHEDLTLHARILEPANLDRSKRHPVLFGPVYSNTVRNRWAGFYGLLQHLFVQKGYLVVQVDVRGSTGYGRKFREDFLGDFAGRDLEDLESAVAHMESLPYVDPDAIGIWGSSYGGTLTAYSLLKKPGLFDAGVACAAAVDPYFFGSDDVAIVRRPETHPGIFERGAAQFADNLEDPLLLIHGMQDQVVPFKTVVDLAEALMRAGKDFDFAFAPAGTHGWTRPRHYARYLLGKLIAHFDRHLLDHQRGTVE